MPIFAGGSVVRSTNRDDDRDEDRLPIIAQGSVANAHRGAREDLQQDQNFPGAGRGQDEDLEAAFGHYAEAPRATPPAGRAPAGRGRSPRPARLPSLASGAGGGAGGGAGVQQPAPPTARPPAGRGPAGRSPRPARLASLAGAGSAGGSAGASGGGGAGQHQSLAQSANKALNPLAAASNSAEVLNSLPGGGYRTASTVAGGVAKAGSATAAGAAIATAVSGPAAPAAATAALVGKGVAIAGNAGGAAADAMSARAIEGSRQMQYGPQDRQQAAQSLANNQRRTARNKGVAAAFGAVDVGGLGSEAASAAGAMAGAQGMASDVATQQQLDNDATMQEWAGEIRDDRASQSARNAGMQRDQQLANGGRAARLRARITGRQPRAEFSSRAWDEDDEDE